MYAAHLCAQGFEPLGFPDALSAMEAARRRRPDVIIAELSLPGIDGIELCRMVGRRYGRRVPVLIVTALASAYYNASAKIAGAARVLPKPCTPDHLELYVRDTLGSWEAWVGRASDLTRTIRQWTQHHPTTRHAWSRPANHTKSRTRDGLVVGTLLTNPSGVILDADGGVIDLTGYSPDQLVGTPIWELCPGASRDKYRAVWRWFQTSGRLRGMVSIVDSDGGVRRYQYESAMRPALGASVSAITPSASVLTT